MLRFKRVGYRSRALAAIAVMAVVLAGAPGVAMAEGFADPIAVVDEATEEDLLVVMEEEGIGEEAEEEPAAAYAEDELVSAMAPGSFNDPIRLTLGKAETVKVTNKDYSLEDPEEEESDWVFTRYFTFELADDGYVKFSATKDDKGPLQAPNFFIMTSKTSTVAILPTKISYTEGDGTTKIGLGAGKYYLFMYDRYDPGVSIPEGTTTAKLTLSFTKAANWEDEAAEMVDAKVGETYHGDLNPYSMDGDSDVCRFKLDKATKIRVTYGKDAADKSTWSFIVMKESSIGEGPGLDELKPYFGTKEDLLNNGIGASVKWPAEKGKSLHTDYVSLDAGTYVIGFTNNEDGGIGPCTSAEYHFKLEKEPAKKNFPDVKPGAWYAGVVGRAAGLGLIEGYDNGNFGPDDKITRAQVAAILWRMAGKPAAGSGAKSFTDVTGSAWYFDPVNWASSVGVVSGYGGGKFGPKDNVTREQLAVMLANYVSKVAGIKASGSASDYAGMADAMAVSGFARPAVGWCFKNKILSGNKGRILPQGNATRAEAAKMIVMTYDLLGM